MKTIKNKQERTGDQGSKLPELAAEIKKHLGEAAGILKRSLGFYRKAGEALIAAKKELDPMRGRGGMAWANWLKTEVGIEKRVAQFYMRLARKWDSLKDHPDFRVDLHYAAALKLISNVAPRNNRHAVAGKIGPSPSAVAQRENPSSDLTTLAHDLAEQEGPLAAQSRETAAGPPSVNEPHSLPEIAQGTAPAKPAVNATAQVVGEADLVVTPSDGYSLAQVLNLLAAGEAVVQEQAKTISRANEVIATFAAKLRDTWKLTNLTAIALAA